MPRPTATNLNVERRTSPLIMVPREEVQRKSSEEVRKAKEVNWMNSMMGATRGRIFLHDKRLSFFPAGIVTYITKPKNTR